MTFPVDLKLSDFDCLLARKKEIRAKEETVGDKTFVFITYMIEDSHTFDSPLARECRGIVFDKETGKCVSRPFHKFFNVGQNQYAMKENIDWKNAVISNKWDGSMAIPHLINDKIIWRTKKSFYSGVADQINRYWQGLDTTTRESVEAMIKFEIDINRTCIFEFVSPDNRIVVHYTSTQLQLLAIRSNHTGRYVHYSGNPDELNSFDENILTEIEGDKDVEGCVIFDGKELYKQKTDWYQKRHKVLSKLSAKFIVNTILDGKMDDVISFMKELTMPERIAELEKAWGMVVVRYREEYADAHSLYDSVKNIVDRKEFALTVTGDPLFKPYASYMFALYDGKEIEPIVRKNVAKEMIPKINDLSLNVMNESAL